MASLNGSTGSTEVLLAPQALTRPSLPAVSASAAAAAAAAPKLPKRSSQCVGCAMHKLKCTYVSAADHGLKRQCDQCLRHRRRCLPLRPSRREAFQALVDMLSARSAQHTHTTAAAPQSHHRRGHAGRQRASAAAPPAPRAPVGVAMGSHRFAELLPADRQLMERLLHKENFLLHLVMPAFSDCTHREMMAALFGGFDEFGDAYLNMFAAFTAASAALAAAAAKVVACSCTTTSSSTSSLLLSSSSSSPTSPSPKRRAASSSPPLATETLSHEQLLRRGAVNLHRLRASRLPRNRMDEVVPWAGFNLAIIYFSIFILGSTAREVRRHALTTIAVITGSTRLHGPTIQPLLTLLAAMEINDCLLHRELPVCQIGEPDPGPHAGLDVYLGQTVTILPLLHRLAVLSYEMGNTGAGVDSKTPDDVEAPPSGDVRVEPTEPTESKARLVEDAQETTALQETTPQETTPQETTLQETTIQETTLQETIIQENIPQETTSQEPTPQEPTPQETTIISPTTSSTTSSTSTFTAAAASLDDLVAAISAWAPVDVPGFEHFFSHNEVVHMRAHARTYRAAALLVAHRLRHPFGAEDAAAEALAIEIAGEMRQAQESTGQHLRYVAMPFLVAAFEAAPGHAQRDEARRMMRERQVISFSPLGEENLLGFLELVWLRRDQAAEKGQVLSWWDVVGEHQRVFMLI